MQKAVIFALIVGASAFLKQAPKKDAAPVSLLEVQSTAGLAQKYEKMKLALDTLMPVAQKQIDLAQKEISEAMAMGESRRASLAEQALEMIQSMTNGVLSQEKDLKDKVSAGALLEEQNVEQIIKTEEGVIKQVVQLAIDHLKNSDGTDQGEALLTAAKTALSLTQTQGNPLELSQQQATQLDAQLREAVQNLQNAETMGTMATAEAQKQVEESVSQILKSAMKNTKADRAQYRQLVGRLSKFLPAEAEQKVNVLAKSGAKNATATKPKTAEQKQQDALQSLQTAMDHPIAALKKSASALLETQASEKALAAEIEKAIKAEESESMGFPFNSASPQAMMEQATKREMEQDLMALAKDPVINEEESKYADEQE